MRICSVERNFLSSPPVRIGLREMAGAMRYHPNMPRKVTPAPVIGPLGQDWYLRDWLAHLRMKQADLTRATDIPKGTMSAIFNGRTNYYRELVNTIADALHIQPYELLMHPDDAMAIRRLRMTAREISSVRLAADAGAEWQDAPPALRIATPKG
jgi:transcriptional regulator with XRE-family HTH domain